MAPIAHIKADKIQVIQHPFNIKKMSKMDWIIFLFIFIPLVINFVITDNEGYRWIVSLTTLSAIPTVVAIQNGFLSDLLPNNLRTFVVFILCCTPPLSFAIGKNEALKILNCIEYKYIEHDSKKYKYIGFLQGRTFFIDIENKDILITLDAENKDILLKKYQK